MTRSQRLRSLTLGGLGGHAAVDPRCHLVIAGIVAVIRGQLVLGIVAHHRRALRRSRRSQLSHDPPHVVSATGGRHRSSCLRVSEVLAVIGELDVVTTSRLMERLASTPTIRILDLSGVRFIDPSGLRILLDIVRTDPQLVIRAPSACVRRLCSLAGLDHIATASCSGPWSAAGSGINVTGSRSMRQSAALERVVLDERARLRSHLEHVAIDDPGRAGDVASVDR